MKMSRTSILLIAVIFASLVACDDGRGGSPDAGGGVDAGMVSMVDSGPRPDTGPPVMVDAGPPAPACGPTSGPCDVATQMGCMTGQACLMVGSTEMGWETVCAMAGVIEGGAACVPGMPGQCREGFQCDSSSNTCVKICCNNSGCDAGRFCGLIAGANAGFCREADTCDPLDGSGCDEGSGCYPASAGNLSCITAGTLGEGETCMFTNHCQVGLGCAGAAGSGVCRRFCRPSAGEGACESPNMCQPLSGFDDLGVCNPPAGS